MAAETEGNPELEALIRLFALNPHKFEYFLGDPFDFISAYQVKPETVEMLKSLGQAELTRMVKELANKLLANPDPANFGRDTTAQGFGARRAE